MGWNLIDTAPFDRDLELAVIDSEGAHSLSFPCRRIEGGWIEVETKKHRSPSVQDNIIQMKSVENHKKPSLFQ